MSGVETFTNGVLTERWDDEVRTYTDFRTDPDTVRPYTAQENADADARATEQTRDANEGTLRGQSLTDIDTLKASIDACNVVIAKTNSQISGADTKDIARQVKAIARAVIRLQRLVLAGGALATTDAGAATDPGGKP